MLPRLTERYALVSTFRVNHPQMRGKSIVCSWLILIRPPPAGCCHYHPTFAGQAQTLVWPQQITGRCLRVPLEEARFGMQTMKSAVKLVPLDKGTSKRRSDTSRPALPHRL